MGDEIFSSSEEDFRSLALPSVPSSSSRSFPDTSTCPAAALASPGPRGSTGADCLLGPVGLRRALHLLGIGHGQSSCLGGTDVLKRIESSVALLALCTSISKCEAHVAGGRNLNIQRHEFVDLELATITQVTEATVPSDEVVPVPHNARPSILIDSLLGSSRLHTIVASLPILLVFDLPSFLKLAGLPLQLPTLCLHLSRERPVATERLGGERLSWRLRIRVEIAIRHKRVDISEWVKTGSPKHREAKGVGETRGTGSWVNASLCG